MLKTIISIIAWLLFLALAGTELLILHWEATLVVLAALVLVPSALDLLECKPGWSYWVVATGLGIAYLLFPAVIAPFAALPYLLMAVWHASKTGFNLLIHKRLSLFEWVRFAALAYWATGAFWAFCFLARIQPLGFDAVMVGLTAAHFHVAGLVLTTAVYCLLSAAPTPANRLLGGAALAGMPLVATGITLTKLGFSPLFEWIAAVCFAVFALSVAWQHIRLFPAEGYSRRARLLWLGGALCLLAGAVLAGLYAMRFSMPIQWVNIPNMKIWHGTLNAVGFGWMVLQGWMSGRVVS